MEGILPFGMLCLSAWRMMFVKMVFAVCNWPFLQILKIGVAPFLSIGLGRRTTTA